MKIAVITLSRIKRQNGQYYNSQDMGLAKALNRAGHEVVVYRLTESEEFESQQDGIKTVFKKVWGIHKQSITGFSFIEEKIEKIICFADNQIIFTALYRFCRKKDIILQPYIGVLRSNSPNGVVKGIMNLLVSVNIRQYRKLTVYAKTPDLQQQLKRYGVEDSMVVPVALDFDLLNTAAVHVESAVLREKHGYGGNDRIILFIGRMEPEKEPFTMLSIMKELYQGDSHYRLIMIGNGRLLKQVEEAAHTLKISHAIQIKERVVNSEMWEYYCMSDCFVNLNRHEIYGMSILEALYYNCPVVAARAPGPVYILDKITPENICDDVSQTVECISRSIRKKEKVDTRKYIQEYFNWDNAVKIFLEERRSQ